MCLNLKPLRGRVREIVLISILSILVTVGKLSLAALPNIEVVSFLFIIYTVVLGFKRALMISVIFTTTEILIWGFGIWTFGYYIFWPLLVLITSLLCGLIKKPLGFAVLSGLFGLSFGLLFALYTAPLTGVNVFAYWASGIVYDVVHMIGNFVVMVVLFVPVRDVLKSQMKKWNINRF